MSAPRERLRTIREELQQLFLERAELIDGALVALLAGQHVLVIGPPGTAKSMLADEVCRRVAGATYFQWLLTRFTTPEELFGAVSLKALEQDDYRRLTTHKLPEAHVAFLDEVFKGSSSILNTILGVMNERRFHNGREVVRVPLLALFGAANELPEDDELLALQDRFLLRFVVDYISEDFRFLKLLQAKPPEARTTLTLAELDAARAEAAALPIPGHVLRAITALRRELGRRGVVASDRRWAQALSVLRGHAYLAGRDAVGDDDVAFLVHVLWRDPAERTAVQEAVRECLCGYEDEVRALLFQSRELRDYALRDWETREERARAAVEAHTKVRSILGKVDDILARARGEGRPVDGAETLRAEIVRIQQEMLARL
ncbi:MAG TPA: AAA family ATPase [Candidatus Binatia bacterium]|nr:AAA family ATPase [Candidatus Binatia bacterium]